MADFLEPRKARVVLMAGAAATQPAEGGGKVGERRFVWVFGELRKVGA